MKYAGTIKELNQMIVSDPSYKKKVWCRYENKNLNMKESRVQLAISEYHDTVPSCEIEKNIPNNPNKDKPTGLNIEGIEFQVLICDPRFKCEVVENGFTHPQWALIKEYTIGMDTACVSIGINNIADTIRRQRNTWQPKSALKTLTDGEFGTVCEGRYPAMNNTLLLYISGYLDKDTGYTENDILNYLKENLKIENLEPVMAEEEENNMEIGEI